MNSEATIFIYQFSNSFRKSAFSMVIFEANFSKQYFNLFIDSRDGHDIYKWVMTQTSLGNKFVYVPSTKRKMKHP